MKTKIVYILVSNNNDFYLEQCLLSVYTLRLHNSEAYVCLVVDNLTAITLVEKRSKIKEYVNEVKVIDLPADMSNLNRSRHLKTCLRQLVVGDYLFIDCDTVICTTLDEIDNLNCDIGLCSDLNLPCSLEDLEVIERCAKIGFENVKGEPYFNSGIMYVKDTPTSHRLYKEWHRMWRLSVDRGISLDQPALCQANINQRYPISEISGIWNCQFKKSQRYVNNAKILHYFFCGTKENKSIQNRLIEDIYNRGEISDIMKSIVLHPRTRFVPLFLISQDSAIEYLNSDLIWIFYYRPITYYRFQRIIHYITRIYIQILRLFGKL